jgi:hypothetical protein
MDAAEFSHLFFRGPICGRLIPKIIPMDDHADLVVGSTQMFSTVQ